MKHIVLVFTRDPNISAVLDNSLTNMDIMIETTGQGIIDKMRGCSEISLFIMDMDLPDRSMIDLLRNASDARNIPMLFISAKTLQKEGSEIQCLTKPLTRSDLMRHIEEQLNRTESLPSRPSDKDILQSGALTVNRKSYQIFIDKQIIHLPMKEFLLLSYMIEHKNLVLTREQMYRAVWKSDDFFDPSVLTVHIKNIRSKLGPCKNYIQTVWGVGYKFRGSPEKVHPAQ